MIEITHSRPPGDRQGPDIVDPLVTSAAGALYRIEGEIDAQYDALLVSTNGYLADDHIEPGALVECSDIEQASYRALVERSAIVIQKSGDSFSATQALELERPDEDGY